jgi:hypothetical protein
LQRRVSFWNPYPVPTNDEKLTVECDLKSIGTKDQITEKLTRIPNLVRISSIDTAIKFFWKAKGGVFLYFIAQPDGDVPCINANSFVPDKTLFRLYVMLYEHLETILLDESSHKFYTVKDFREIVK